MSYKGVLWSCLRLSAACLYKTQYLAEHCLCLRDFSARRGIGMYNVHTGVCVFICLRPKLANWQNAKLHKLFLSWIISQTLLKREWGEGAAGLKSSSRNSFKACKHVLLVHLIHLLPSRLSLSCRGRGFICWVTVWEHMWLGLPATSPTIKSAGSQVRTLN